MYVWVQQKNSQLFSFLVCVWPLNMKWFAIRINNSRYSAQFHLNEQTMAKHRTQSIHPFDWTRKRVKKQSFLSGLLNCHHFMLCQGFDSTRLDSTLLDYLTAINSLSEHWVITRGAGQFNFLLWIRDKMLKSAHFQRSFFFLLFPLFFVRFLKVSL